MLRDYQREMSAKVIQSQAKATMGVLPTGAGKTVIMSNVFNQLKLPSLAIAHRQELVSQISLALARNGVHHGIIAPDNVIQFCINQHHEHCGRSLYAAGASTLVAGVDTLIRRNVDSWAHNVKLIQLDEAHHCLPDNKWGKAIAKFPNAKLIGWTATPCRTDRKPLSWSFQEMHIGPSMRDLINRGYLSDYRIYGPAHAIDRSALTVGSSGEYTRSSVEDVAEKANITGDIVAQYLKHARGKRGITFAASVRLAQLYAEAYRMAGVPAAFIDAKTPDRERADLIKRFAAGDLLQLCNVDIFGEGFDLPAIEAVSMARPTKSYGLYVQVFGRGLRLADGKSHGIIIDHVGNVMEHGLPDAPRDWSLETGYNPSLGELEIPIRMCTECLHVWESYGKQCPMCGHQPERAAATEPEQVDGDLTEYHPDLLAQMRKEAAKAVRPSTPGTPAHIARNIDKRAFAQHQLRERIADWAGYWRDIHKADDPEIYTRFYKTFGMDVMQAQTLKPKQADELRERIEHVHDQNTQQG